MDTGEQQTGQRGDLVALWMANRSACVLSGDDSSAQERFYFSGWISSLTMWWGE